MNFGISRRALLSAAPIALAVGSKLAAQAKQQASKKGKPLPRVGEFTREIDPVTENTIVRLTSTSSVSILPYPRHHFVSARERILLFASNRGGRFAPYVIDLRTGVTRQITDTSNLAQRSLSLDHQEKSALYLDGGSLFEANLSHGTSRVLKENVSSFTSAADGSLYAIAAGKLQRKAGNDFITLAEGVADVWPQPDSTGCLFSRSMPDNSDAREFYYIQNKLPNAPTLIANGKIREPFWDRDGQSILFLRDVTSPNGVVLAEIHGRSVNGGDEYLVSTTSQFASFAPNGDASVFVGASRSRAQPNVILMLRTPHREMTLCEHRASHPAEVSPVFSPDNRRVYFESDHEGNSAIYSINVELLVEPE